MLDIFNYAVCLLLMMIAMYGIIVSNNLIKKLMVLSIFQVSVLLFYMSGGYVKNGAAPILKEGLELYVNPIPQVLMLTAIVVGVATMAVGLAISLRIFEEYGTIEEDEIKNIDSKKSKKVKKKK